eukprot:3622268-Lingulodinium_polyedra.AAC.1
MLKATLPPVLPVIRRRSARWKLEGFPGRNAERAVEAIEAAWKLAPPRAAAVVLSTLFNRRATSRRLQQRR